MAGRQKGRLGEGCSWQREWHMQRSCRSMGHGVLGGITGTHVIPTSQVAQSMTKLQSGLPICCITHCGVDILIVRESLIALRRGEDLTRCMIVQGTVDAGWARLRGAWESQSTPVLFKQPVQSQQVILPCVCNHCPPVHPAGC